MARESKRKRDEKRFGKAKRLGDAILEYGLVPLPILEHPLASNPWAQEAWSQGTRRVLNSLRQCSFVDCQNVYDYCVGSFSGKDIDYHHDVPNWMPPLSPMFLEFIGRSGCQFGYLVETFGGKNRPVPFEIPDDVSGQHCVLLAELFSRPVGVDRVTGPIASVVLGIDESGCHVGSIRACIGFSSMLSVEEEKAISDAFRPTIFPAGMSIAFMHCKNVTLQSSEPSPVFNKERKKNSLPPFVRYHTINIEPMKKVLRTEGNIETEGLKKALHICRGHFSHYSEEKPLFGKYAGTFWVPAHVRGSIDKGVVVSDYKVKATDGSG